MRHIVLKRRICSGAVFSRREGGQPVSGSCGRRQETMSSKRGLKDKLGMAIYDNPRLNEKLLIMKKSFDEVNKGLQGGRKKEDKK